ncbi:DNA gyrase inhibitor YacG [Aquicoccus porphyridii]|uniref:DNA gyrase inhibitor YacG n=1 Tax=Aquicoccus porphyridii TaxID=1852029 RepID=A0A5A9YZ33_9RHOB|nr:DNA gyrase inhibitor YacG [Aquicoccus porphyridii]KAA0910124.1 DNA gyrase inhibitor YacG [Aquicoccus porphyridii]RAI53429.1 DNA gyrase inhibitor YacG [Rhodobacteraceae bacterium AsT-22]
MTCPICSAKTNPRYRPFCSKRCADIDLAHWLGGGYAVPSNDPDDAEEVLDALEKALAPETRKPH